MNCPNCNQPLPEKARFCPRCGAKVPKATQSQRVGAIAVDATQGQSIINIGTTAESAGPAGGHCPICGAYNPPEATFRCLRCGRDYICRTHQDPNTFWCLQCAGRPAQPSSTGLFQLNYQFLHPYVPQDREALAQVLVSFTSRDDVDTSALAAMTTHLCLVLDVSGSMNTADKYPLLRQAIPHLIGALADDDYLTIVLFSQGHEVAFSEPVARCRQRVDQLLSRIDHSGVMFGRMTMLSPALSAAIDEIEHLRAQSPMTVSRLYILTDGELHDADACYTLNPRLRTLEADVNSYGFGRDFALGTMKRIVEGVPGGTVKPIFDTRDVQWTFGHIGELAERIVAREAGFSFVFSPDVIPGDAFLYQPGSRYFGPVDHQSRTFRIPLGTLERDRVYSFLFEGRLQPAAKERQEMGRACLRYVQSGRVEEAETSVWILRSDDEWRLQRPNEAVQEVYDVLNALRNDSRESQLQALHARKAIYERRGADPHLVALVNRAIEKLERGESLTQEEKRGLGADEGTACGLGL